MLFNNSILGLLAQVRWWVSGICRIAGGEEGLRINLYYSRDKTVAM
jgi:hypothetical protein